MPLHVVDGESYQAPATIEPDCDWPIIMDCSPSTAFTPEIVALAKQFAASVMNAATARRYGVCTSTFRPLCPPSCNPGHQDGWALVDPKVNGMIGAEHFRAYMNGSCGCDDGGWYGCSCGQNTKLRLWHQRVVDVSQVLIDGTVLSPDSYYLDGNVLVRDDGFGWPTDQTGRRGETGSWEISYRHGIPVPPAGMVATGVLACEIAMALSADDECSLPARTKTYTNHAGLTIGFIDPMEFLSDGLTGLYVPDQWITRVNPHKITRRARAYSYGKRRRDARRVPNPVNLATSGFEVVYTGDTDETVVVQLNGDDITTLAGATDVQAHVWTDPNFVTVLDATIIDAANRYVEVDLGDASGWLANLVQAPGEVVQYNLQVQVTFGADVSTWPPDILTVIGQAA